MGEAGRAVHLEHEITVELPADAVVVVRLQRQRLELGLEVTPNHARAQHQRFAGSGNPEGGALPADNSNWLFPGPHPGFVGREPAVFLLGRTGGGTYLERSNSMWLSIDDGCVSDR